MLTEWDDAGRASLHVFVNPLVSWIWGGGAVYLLGMVMLFWPPTSVQPMAVRSSVRSGGNRVRRRLEPGPVRDTACAHCCSSC